MKSYKNCPFYVVLIDEVVCVAPKRGKGYSCIKENCKYWLEDTPENAEKELKKLENEKQRDA